MRDLSETVREAKDQAKGNIRKLPMTSVALAGLLGAGLGAGAVACLNMLSRRRT